MDKASGDRLKGFELFLLKVSFLIVCETHDGHKQPRYQDAKRHNIFPKTARFGKRFFRRF